MKADSPSPAYGDRAVEKGSGRITWDGVLFLLVSGLTLFSRFRSPSLLLGSYQDDFFYYLQIAKNIADTGVSTFNGLHLTNGYHPLWMAVLVCLYRVFPGNAFFVAVQIVCLLAAAASWYLMLRILQRYLPNAPARAAAFVLGLEALLLIRYGMEVTLTLPLAALLLYRLVRSGVPTTFGSSAVTGLLAALLILSRLDAALLVALLFVAALPLWPRDAGHGLQPLRSLTGFLCGIVPLLLLYCVVNLHVFHVLTPVSGMAKQLRSGHSPSARAWISLLPNNRMRRVVQLPEVLLIVTGVVVLAMPGVRRRIQAAAASRWFAVALLGFPLLHLLLISVLSDWTVWPWYFYSFTLACLPACALVVVALPRTVGTALLCAYGAVLTVYAAVYALQGPSSLTVFESSRQVARYMDANPGVYMMGDQAGTTQYLAHHPIVQTEGLVMDKRFLQLMRMNTPLAETAKAYGATYYTTIGGDYHGACLSVVEPSNAGPESPHMHGTICHAPLVTFYRGADGAPIRIFRTEWIR